MGQRNLWPYDHQPHLFFPGKAHHGFIVFNGNISYTHSSTSHTRIAWNRIDLAGLGTLMELPDQRMLTATAADY